MAVDGTEICEHGDIRAACIDCLEAPRPHVPKAAGTPSAAKPAERPTVLSGSKDISVPVYELGPYVEKRTDWLMAQGFAHDLRVGGFVYLRVGNGLRARVSAVRMEWRDSRPWRTGEGAAVGEDAGEGYVFVVDPTTWTKTDIELGELAETQRSGYRYLMTRADGTVEHLSAGDPVPDGDWMAARVRDEADPT